MRAKLTVLIVIGMIVMFWAGMRVGSYLTDQRQKMLRQEIVLEHYRGGSDADTIAEAEKWLQESNQPKGLLGSWQFALIVGAIGMQGAFWAKGKLAALNGGRRKQDIPGSEF
ncbi:MAG: hypothetical protein IFK94_04190 [Acidobacteria bacterium]|uniref:Uncharacterized protein n=1 Tax=Candidatus Polarisedimenticola svalbardensis TaxID=2886004 RepID=A0A8J7C2A3_9BACT|nr:hypothetical protein [Candidatus Polarisedimenticola svalbardensis]